MLEYLRYHGIPFVVVLTKADKLKKSELAPCQARFEAICAEYGCRRVFLTSAEKGTGVEEVRACLDAQLEAAD